MHVEFLIEFQPTVLLILAALAGVGGVVVLARWFLTARERF